MIISSAIPGILSKSQSIKMGWLGLLKVIGNVTIQVDFLFTLHRQGDHLPGNFKDAMEKS